MENSVKKDIFICHASEDKQGVAIPLSRLLNENHISCWLDEAEIKWGDSIISKVNDGLRNSTFTVVILSKSFIEKNWPQAELFIFLNQEFSSGKLKVLPLLVGDSMSIRKIIDKFPILSQKKYLCWDTQNDEIINELKIHLSDSSQIPLLDNQISLVNEVYYPIRRIRIQISKDCTQECPWCHNDEFDLNETGQNDYLLLKELLVNIKSMESENICPKPNIYFVLTGGEPLKAGFSSGFDHWKSFITINPHKTLLVTNAWLLNNNNIASLNNVIDDIHISLNPFDFSIIKVSEKQYFEKVISNIKNLLKMTTIKIRFNTVVYDRDSLKIDDYIKYLNVNFGLGKSGNQIIGIAFIQKFAQIPNTDFDLFKIAKSWVEDKNLSFLNNNSTNYRKLIVKYENLQIEFIKVNCDFHGDLVTRCFSCAREKDIAVASDGRIRMCRKWDSNFNSIYSYYHIDSKKPLHALSVLIKTQYHFVSFYCHFPFIVRLLNNNINIDEVSKLIPDLYFDLESFLRNIGIRNDSGSQLGIWKNLIYEFMYDRSFFTKIYLENDVIEKLKFSFKMSIGLVKNIYIKSYNISNIENKNMIFENKCILSLNFLFVIIMCFDESLLSNVNTLIIKGLAQHLIDCLYYKDAFSYDFLNVSTYCISTLALENENGSVVLSYLDGIVSEENVLSSSFLSYIKGYIFNKDGDHDKAILYLENAKTICDGVLNNPVDIDNFFLALYKNIRSEIYKTLSSSYSKKNPQDIFSSNYRQKALFYSTIDKSSTRFSILFSEGYNSMKLFFNNEFNTGVINEGYKAHTCFHYSIELKSDFYASLIRMGLLELALDQSLEATIKLSRVREIFSNKGYLTDQEYLNYILNELIFRAVDINLCNYLDKLSSYDDSDIVKCTKVELNDILCVKTDSSFLKKYLTSHTLTEANRNEVEKLIREIDVFSGNLDKLYLIVKSDNA